MTFLISVILLSTLMILLSILSMIGHLICGNNLSWLLCLNLIYETLWTGAGSGLLFNAGKKHLLSFDRSNNNTYAIMWKWMGLFLRKASSFQMVRLTLSFKLNWCSCIIYIAQTAFKKIGALIRSIDFFLLRSPCTSLQIYHMALHGILFSCLGCWYSYLLLGNIKADM